MKKNNIPPVIFLSYSHKNRDVANTFDKHFMSVGITFQRDIREVNYRDSFKDFMNKIPKSDFVVMIISDEYLRSEFCMYEVTEVINTHEFEKRILPVLLDNAKCILDIKSRVIYYDYWKTKLLESEKQRQIYPNEDYLEQYKRLANINLNLDTFFLKLTNLRLIDFESLKEEKYRSMLQIIGIDEIDLLNEVIEIGKIEEKEDQDIALEKFLFSHPNNHYALFQKANLSKELKQFKKAKLYYEELLKQNENNAKIHFDFGSLLENHFADYEGAKKHYNLAYSIYTDYIEAYNAQAELLSNHFKDYKGAKDCWELGLKVIPELNDVTDQLISVIKKHVPNGEEAVKKISQTPYLPFPQTFFEETEREDQHHCAVGHGKYALLLKNHFSDYDEARKHLEIAIKIEPNLSNAHYHLAILLEDNFKDYEQALSHYKRVIEINNNDYWVYYEIALLLSNQFGDFNQSRIYYEKAIEIKPDYLEANYNLALILYANLQDYNGAKKHFERSIEIDPTYPNMHYNLGRLLDDHFSDFLGAKNHYLKAVELNPDHAWAHGNLALLLLAHFSERELAIEHWEKAKQLNPQEVGTKSEIFNSMLKLSDSLYEKNKLPDNITKAADNI